MSRMTKTLLILALSILVASWAIGELSVQESNAKAPHRAGAAQTGGPVIVDATWGMVGMVTFLLGMLLLFGGLLSYVSDQRRSRAKSGWRL